MNVVRWQVLLFSGTFNYQLNVAHDPVDNTVVFKMLQSSFMSACEGRWKLSPVGEDDVSQTAQTNATSSSGGAGGSGSTNGSSSSSGRGADGSSSSSSTSVAHDRPPATAEAASPHGDGGPVEGDPEAGDAEGGRLSSGTSLHRRPQPPSELHVMTSGQRRSEWPVLHACGRSRQLAVHVTEVRAETHTHVRLGDGQSVAGHAPRACASRCRAARGVCAALGDPQGGGAAPPLRCVAYDVPGRVSQLSADGRSSCVEVCSEQASQTVFAAYEGAHDGAGGTTAWTIAEVWAWLPC
ncbi:MAG: hypothetical protein WDW36_001063 [Sanguina aurantia]